jgi:hypothetical protein
MKLMKVSEIFDVRYGHSLELNRLKQVGPEGIPFVSRQMGNNGISAFVEPIPGVDPAPAGELSCALSGNGILSTFIQERPFYTAFHVACLRPKVKLSLHQKLYYCTCIKQNRYRYSFGRQANRTLRDILVPSSQEIPKWVNETTIEQELSRKLDIVANLSSSRSTVLTDVIGHERVFIDDLFKVVYGHSLELNRLTRSENGVNFISRTSKCNGVSAVVNPIPGLAPAPSGLITVACGGSVLETFLQLEPFYCGRDMYWLEPRMELSIEEKLFYCACIRANKFRYNYGRQANKTLRHLEIPAQKAIPSCVYGSLSGIASEWKSKLALSA